MPTLYTMTVDTEEEWDWNGPFPTDDLAVTNIDRLPQFQALCERHGVATTYFTNYAVFHNPQSRATLLRIAERPRVEIGMHIHPWNTPPLDKARPAMSRASFLHNLDKDWVRAKLATVYQCFVDVGLRPTSFRGGRYSSGVAIHDFLRDHRFVADSSVVPFTTWPEDGAPDYRGRDLTPIRLAPRVPGEPALWEIPLTLGFNRLPFTRWARFQQRVADSWLRRLKLVGVADRLGLVRRAWLNFENPLGTDMLEFLNVLRPLKLPFIVLTIHSSSLAAGKGIYTRTPEDEGRLFSLMERVFATLATWEEYQPATMTEIAHHLEKAFHANPGDQPA